ncbi:hypothetical protein [Spiroplasma citri]|uniref:hypothetical protein n=2 Tax=Spiroplasma citri TaxID=2133 RepID=UPI0020A471D9|nr:hypothetical protein [Spiroplasma citri]
MQKITFLIMIVSKKTIGITRGNEGLYIHHIDEDKAIMLSTPAYAKKNPFDYQKADHLVYCNLLEHLVLHIKIVEYPNPAQNSGETCGVGGIYNYIVPELNDIYSGIVYKQSWKQKVTEIILPLKNDYFKCIKQLVNLNFDYALLKSFNTKYDLWSNDKNKQIYKRLKKLGVTR